MDGLSTTEIPAEIIREYIRDHGSAACAPVCIGTGVNLNITNVISYLVDHGYEVHEQGFVSAITERHRGLLMIIAALLLWMLKWLLGRLNVCMKSRFSNN